jgi:hypothetical protein
MSGAPTGGKFPSAGAAWIIGVFRRGWGARLVTERELVWRTFFALVLLFWLTVIVAVWWLI